MLQSHTSTFNAEPYFQTVNRNFHSQFEYGSAINVWWDIACIVMSHAQDVETNLNMQLV